MADPRFYDNKGPFSLAEICAALAVPLPEGADGTLKIYDLADLKSAAPGHLTFFLGGKAARADFGASAAGVCLVPEKPDTKAVPPEGCALVPCGSVKHAFAAVANLFYPDNNLCIPSGDYLIDPTAKIGEGVVLAPGVVVGPQAEIGENTKIGAYTVIGRGVAIGKNCEIGPQVSLSHAFVGDCVTILPGAKIGQPGFGFAGSSSGHTKIPQLGRVIIQDKVEIGACTTIDRGALGDTVVGEGTKIDNLVQIAHSVHIGRHCIIVSQCGISGSCEVGDFVTFGGQAGIADHCRIGSMTRLAGRTAMTTGQVLEGGRDYAGVPAKPLMDWIREVYAVAALIKKTKRDKND